MVLKDTVRGIPSAPGLLLWCLLGTALVAFELARVAPGSPPGNPFGFSPIYWYLLGAYDAHGNLLLAAIAVLAFLLRKHPAIEGLLRFAADRPWILAGAAFAAFGAGALWVYRAYPLSMDEYAALFQAQVFAAGRLTGQFPPDQLEQLLPRFPTGMFFTVARATGEVSTGYWPGFALLVAPFAWLGIPWAANPFLSALTLPVVHRLALELSDSREAAGWTVLLLLASPVFVVNALAFYAMPAHLLCNAAYALLLLRPTPTRALLAGLVGSFALTLHNPAPHLLFGAAFLAWLLLRRAPVAVLAALVAGYLPVVALLGWGWQHHLAALAANVGNLPNAGNSVPAAAVAANVPLSSLPGRLYALAASALTLPTTRIVEARLAGLSKVWTWGAAGLMLLAAWGYAAAQRIPGAMAGANALAAALLATFVGYFFVPFDQGHGWGFRYLHSAWFVLPLFGAVALARLPDPELRGMAAWAVVLSLLLANGLRIAQVDGFMARHLAQVPPLARPVAPGRAEIVFIDPERGSYLRDMVHNDPFLREARITMVYDGPERTAALMARRFPDYTRSMQGTWGELWTK